MLKVFTQDLRHGYKVQNTLNRLCSGQQASWVGTSYPLVSGGQKQEVITAPKSLSKIKGGSINPFKQIKTKSDRKSSDFSF